MKIFIYGGTGYLGSSLTSAFGDRYNFICTTRRKKIKKKDNVKILNEINDKKKIYNELKESDLILIANGPSSKESQTNLFKYIGYLNDQIKIILKLKKKKTKVVYFSTIHVYANNNLHKAKTDNLLNAKSHYAIRNIVCENLISNNFKCKNFNIIRMSNIYGIQNKSNKKNQNMFRLAVNQFCLDIVNNKDIIINSNINEKRNFVSINDFVRFIEISFIEKKLKLEPIINYTSKRPISLKMLIKTIIEQSKKLKIKIPNINFKNKQKNSKINYNFDINILKKYKIEPKILLSDEIYNSLNKIKSFM